MNILITVILSWLLIGIVGGLICSYSDYSIRGRSKFDYVSCLVCCPAGGLLFLYSLFYFFESFKSNNKVNKNE